MRACGSLSVTNLCWEDRRWEQSNPDTVFVWQELEWCHSQSYLDNFYLKLIKNMIIFLYLRYKRRARAIFILNVDASYSIDNHLASDVTAPTGSSDAAPGCHIWITFSHSTVICTTDVREGNHRDLPEY